MGGAVGEGVFHFDGREELEDGALHGEFVEVGVEEGEDAFGGGGGGVGHAGRLVVRHVEVLVMRVRL